MERPIGSSSSRTKMGTSFPRGSYGPPNAVTSWFRRDERKEEADVKVRCVCGRYMPVVARELANAVSGGREEYRCRRCGARAVIWHAHRLDDWPVDGAIWDAAGREADLVYDDNAMEWRPKGGAR